MLAALIEHMTAIAIKENGIPLTIKTVVSDLTRGIIIK
jgi:hypothetical protein